MSYSPQAPSSEEKKTFDTPDRRPAPSRTVSTPRGYSAWFGGPAVTVGPRIGPVLDGIAIDSDTDDSSSAILDKQIALEDGHAIQYRTCSWQKVRTILRTLCSNPLQRLQLTVTVSVYPTDGSLAIFRVHLLGKCVLRILSRGWPPLTIVDRPS